MDYREYPSSSGPSDAYQPSSFSRSWSVGEVISTGWAAFQRDPVTLVASVIVGYLVLFASSWFFTMLGGGESAGFFASMLSSIVSSVLSAFVTVGWLRIFVTAARGEKAELGQLFSGGDATLWMFVGNFLMGLGVALGLVLLIVPGVVLALGWSLAGLHIADAGLGPIGAITASWDATSGQKMNLLGLFIVLGLICLAGALLCGVGLLVAIPVSGVAVASVYVRLTGRTSSHTAASGHSTIAHG